MLLFLPGNRIPDGFLEFPWVFRIAFVLYDVFRRLLEEQRMHGVLFIMLHMIPILGFGMLQRRALRGFSQAPLFLRAALAGLLLILGQLLLPFSQGFPLDKDVGFD